MCDIFKDAIVDWVNWLQSFWLEILEKIKYADFLVTIEWFQYYIKNYREKKKEFFALHKGDKSIYIQTEFHANWNQLINKSYVNFSSTPLKYSSQN